MLEKGDPDASSYYVEKCMFLIFDAPQLSQLVWELLSNVHPAIALVKLSYYLFKILYSIC